jgi:hypothetical protein
MDASTNSTESSQRTPATAASPALPGWVKPSLILWPLACVLAAGAYVQVKLRDLQGEVVSRPPLAIIDVNREVMKRIDANPSAGADAATREVYAMGAKLARSGYIVINANSIVAFPEEYGVAQ